MLMGSANITNAQDAPKDDFKPSGNVWGMLFGDYYYKPHADSLGRGAGNVQYKGVAPSSTSPNPNGMPQDAFQIRRAYLGFDYNISRKFTASMVLSHEEGSNQAGAGMNLDAGGSNTVYLKIMSLKWANIFKGSNLIIGQQTTCSFATPFGSEQNWSYRSIERTVMDMHNVDGSSDMGVSLQGSLWKQKNAKDTLKPALIGYQLMIANGNSAKPENDRFKKWRGTLYASILQQKLTFGVYGDFNTVQLSPYLLTNQTSKAYIQFKGSCFRLGVEAFQQMNKNGDIVLSTKTSKNDTTNCEQFGWSVFGSARIIKDKLSVFARFDQYNPDTKFSSSNYKYIA